MAIIATLPPELDKRIAHDLLDELEHAGQRKMDLFSLAPACKDTNATKYLTFFLSCGYVDYCEVRVFGADFTCYGITRAGHEYRKWLGDGQQI